MWQCHDIARWLAFTCNIILCPGDLCTKGVGEVKGTGSQAEKGWRILDFFYQTQEINNKDMVDQSKTIDRLDKVYWKLLITFFLRDDSLY